MSRIIKKKGGYRLKIPMCFREESKADKTKFAQRIPYLL